jgi:membrane protease YdiL (CAAX protease family)
MAPAVPPQVVFLLLALIAGSFLLWMGLLARLWRGETILAAEPHPPVAWSGWDVLLLIFSIFVLQTLAAQVTLGLYGAESLEKLPGHGRAALLASTGIAMLLVVAFGVALFRQRGARRAADFGVRLDPATLARDARIAGGAFLAALLPVYALQIVLTQWYPKQHPVLEMVREKPSAALLAASVFSVVLVAPLAEEFVFRLALQGWLEKHWRRRRAELSPPDVVDAELADEPPEPAEPSSAPPDHNPFAPPRVESQTPPERREPPPDESPLRGRWGLLPVLISSIIFSALHYGAGPEPISLLPLAFILGFVFLRTGRLLPCVLIHMLFNGLNLSLLALSL